MPKQKFVINKIPLNNSIIHRSQKFPQMPTMYLELIENKNKVKPNLINKPYTAPEILTENIEHSVDEGAFQDSNYNPDPDSDIESKKIHWCIENFFSIGRENETW